jgi:tRNA-dihydrouridine synthase
VPIIANGDVFSRADAERVQAETGCDGFLIARGAIRSPWIFRELRGAGPGLPSAEELTAAEARYFADATRLGSKPKYLEWHREGFRRLRARIEGKPVSGPALPANEHMR